MTIKARFVDEQKIGAAFVPASPRLLAEAFCEMNYEEQAEFFACVEETMRAWGVANFLSQTHWIGRALRARADSDRTLGREFVSELHSAITETPGDAQ